MGKKLSPGVGRCHTGARARPASPEPRNTVLVEPGSRLVFMVSGPALRASRNDSMGEGDEEKVVVLCDCADVVTDGHGMRRSRRYLR